MGGPHQGVAQVPHIGPHSFINNIVRLCFFKFGQNWVGPCGYIRSLKYYKEYQRG